MSAASDGQERTLFQFPISHYCEKARWTLDAKGISYRVANLMPGAHRFKIKRLTGKTTVPVLMDRGVAVADSTEIALHVEREHPEHPLLPTDPAERRRALELEAYFDDVAGIHARRWGYGQLLDVPGMSKVMFREYPLPLRLLGRLVTPLMRGQLRKLYQITPESIAESHHKMHEGFDRIEKELGNDPSRYLVGDRLTIADITAASLYAPMVAPPGSPWETDVEVPRSVTELRAALGARTAGKWLLRLYREDRKRVVP